MRLRIEGDLKHPRVVNAQTGEELEGVVSVDWDTRFDKCEVWLSNAAIDVAIDGARVDAVTSEGDKYAFTKLLDIAGLRWRKRD